MSSIFRLIVDLCSLPKKETTITFMKGRNMIYTTLIFYLIIGLNGNKVNNGRKKYVLNILYVLPMFILTALRDVNVGPDTINYYNIFYRISYANNVVEAIRNSSLESGYVILNYFISHLGMSYFVFQIIISIFIYYSLINFVNNYSMNIGMSYFLFWINFQTFGTMNQVRMWIAIMIVTRSTKYLCHRELIKFVLTVLIASQFHLSSLIFLIMYPLSRKDINVRNIAIVIIISILVRIYFLPLMTHLTNKFNIYETYLTEGRLEKNKISLVLSLAIHINYLIFILFTDNNIIKKGRGAKHSFLALTSSDNVSIYNISFWALVVMIGLSIIGLTFNMVGRLIHFFTIYLLIIIPIGFDNISNKNNKVIIKYLMFIILTIQFIIIMIYRPEWYQISNYQFFY